MLHKKRCVSNPHSPSMFISGVQSSSISLDRIIIILIQLRTWLSYLWVKLWFVQLQCCGVHDYKDWLETSWFNRTGGHSVPHSCCNSTFSSCNGTVEQPWELYAQVDVCIQSNNHKHETPQCECLTGPYCPPPLSLSFRAARWSWRCRFGLCWLISSGASHWFFWWRCENLHKIFRLIRKLRSHEGDSAHH